MDAIGLSCGCAQRNNSYRQYYCPQGASSLTDDGLKDSLQCQCCKAPDRRLRNEQRRIRGAEQRSVGGPFSSLFDWRGFAFQAGLFTLLHEFHQHTLADQERCVPGRHHDLDNTLIRGIRGTVGLEFLGSECTGDT